MANVILNRSRKIIKIIKTLDLNKQTAELINVVQVTPCLTESMGRAGRAINWT